MYHPDGSPIIEGEENEWYKGFLIVASNQSFNEIKDDLIYHDHDIGEFMEIKNREDFYNYLENTSSKDGAFVFDIPHLNIARAYVLKNHFSIIPKEFNSINMLPEDFASFEKISYVSSKDIGTKTNLAITIPHINNNIETFQIKRTAFSSLGMGKVTHFNSQGLVEEFFLMYNSDTKGPFINQKYKIEGIYRKYERKNGKLVCISEKPVHLK